MKKKNLIAMLAAAALAACVLTACAENDSSDGGAASSSSGNTSGSGSKASSAAGSTSSGSGSAAASNNPDGADADADSSVSAEDTYDAENQGGEDPGAADEKNFEENSEGYSWDGDYMNAGGQTLSITSSSDGGTFDFQFGAEGAAGTATVNGTKAVFNGDDSYVVTFTLDGDSIDVSTTNAAEEATGEDSANAIDGSYTRQ